jgi:hypothetical protein
LNPLADSQEHLELPVGELGELPSAVSPFQPLFPLPGSAFDRPIDGGDEVGDRHVWKKLATGSGVATR